MRIPSAELLHSIDLSAVRANQTDIDIAALIDTARRTGCGLVTVLPSQTALARRLLGTTPMPRLGGNVGFPSGGQTTAVKISEAQELVQLGCDELDMVINLSALLSGRLADVRVEIVEVCAAAQGRPVKVILECLYLDQDQMQAACAAAVEGGAAFVKTGSGWTQDAANPETVRFLKSCVGEHAGVKASGGIRSLEQLLALYAAGARRFGLGLRSSGPILAALTAHTFFEIGEG